MRPDLFRPLSSIELGSIKASGVGVTHHVMSSIGRVHLHNYISYLENKRFSRLKTFHWYIKFKDIVDRNLVLLNNCDFRLVLIHLKQKPIDVLSAKHDGGICVEVQNVTFQASKD